MPQRSGSAAPFRGPFCVDLSGDGIDSRRLPLPPQQIRQLRDVRRGASRLVSGKQLGRRAPPRFLLEIEICQRACSVLSRTMKQAAFASSIVQGGGKRRAGMGDGSTAGRSTAGSSRKGDDVQAEPPRRVLLRAREPSGGD